jgi:hypothetical protein
VTKLAYSFKLLGNNSLTIARCRSIDKELRKEAIRLILFSLVLEASWRNLAK